MGRPRVGLVLGAGGVAGGAFHAGMLSALEAATGWDPRRAAIIVGTSAGSITGTSLRAGLPAADLMARVEGRPLSAEGGRLLRNVGAPRRPQPRRPVQARPPRQLAATLARAAARPFSSRPWALMAGLLPEGPVSTDMISDAISEVVGDEWPAEPLWVCAVRQTDGRRVVFGRDDRRPPLPDVVAASCAIPGYFSPVLIDGESYIDGGVHSPTNADALAGRDLDLDLVIVSSPMSLSGRGIRLSADQAVRRWSRALLDAEALRLRRRGVPVIAFQPSVEDAAVMGVNAMDPTRAGAIARQTRASTLLRLARADTRSRLAALA